jgi:DNA topoisomerase-6 subunit B
MSYQSTLGEEEGIAEELAASQREISIAEFFEKNKHMLGFDSGARGLVTAVKEAVDNALDAAEEAGIKPDIAVEIREAGDYYRVVVEDNGPGITREQVPKVFGKLLYGSRFHKREQNRGQQGIGISAAVLYAQLTSGEPAKITSRTKGSDTADYFELIIDTDTNEPEIRTEEKLSPGEARLNPTNGTRIELEMEANMRARSQLHDYVKHTAVVNPHARIRLLEPGLDDWWSFERAEGAELPAETSEIRPHPHGVELGTLLKMLEATDSYSVSGFLQEEFTRVGSKTAAEILDAFRDRHYGREMSWRPPDEGVALADAVAEAVANKSREATADFAAAIADALRDRERVSHADVEAAVADAARDVAAAHEETFGETVRAHAVEAAWTAVAGDRERLAADLYERTEDATSSRKAEEAVRGLADRLAAKFEDGGQRHRLTREALSEFVDRSAEMTAEATGETFGETARENVVEALWAVAGTVPDEPPNVATVADDRNVARELLDAMAATDIISPPTDCLAPITADLVEAGLRKEYDADFYAAATREADVHAGDPFIVEAGIAYGGELEDDGEVGLMRFANRVPLVYQRGACATSDVVRSIGWRNYGLDQPGGSGMPNGPCVLLVHVASTNVPFTSESKDAVANVPEIEDEIELAIREAARELKSYLNKRRSLEKRREKQDVIATILPEMAQKVAEVTGRETPAIDDAMARIMNNVLIERTVEDGAVRLTVENHDSASETLDVTEIVSAEPADVSAGTVVEMDGEWFVRWEPTVGSGGSETLEYAVDGDADFELSVEGIESEKLTVDQ